MHELLGDRGPAWQKQPALSECAQALEEAYGKWEAALAQIEETVIERSYAAAPEHAQEVIAFALSECKEAMDEGLDDLAGAAGLVEDTLGELAQEATRRADAVRNDGQNELSSGHAELIKALTEAAGALDQVKALLASFTFVQI